MKKLILTLLLTIGLIIPSLRGDDFLCVKEHGSALLEDQNWHTLTYEEYLNNGKHIYQIAIKKQSSGDYFTFKDESKPRMLAFYVWLTDNMRKNGFGLELEDEDVSITKQGDVYVGTFHNRAFIPIVDVFPSFIGIDVFK